MRASLIVFVVVLSTHLATIGSASAFPLKQQMSPDDLKVTCGKSGGAYGSGPTSGTCVGKSGNIVTCDNDKHCEGQVIHTRTITDAVPFGSAGAGSQHHADANGTAAPATSAKAEALQGTAAATTAVHY